MGVVLSGGCSPPETEKPPPTFRLELKGCRYPTDVPVPEEYVESWGNKDEDILADLAFKSIGPITFSVGVSETNHEGEACIEIEMEGETIKAAVPESTNEDGTYTVLPMGTVTIQNAGVSTLRIRAKEAVEGAVGKLHFVELSGEAVHKIGQFDILTNTFPPAADVTLKWKTKTQGMDMFYNEACISESRSARFVVCGFTRGFLAMDEDGVTFSIVSSWMSTTMQTKSGVTYKIPDRYLAKVVDQAFGVKFQYFNNERDVECSFPYKWQTGEIARCMLVAKTSSKEHAVYYSAFYYNNKYQKWAFLATFKVMEMIRSFSELYSCIKDCDGFHADSTYKTTYGPAWKHVKGKGWAHLTQAEFSPDESTQAPRDYNAGLTEDNKMFLSTGGTTRQSSTASGDKLRVQVTTDLPECLDGIDVSSVDSLKDRWQDMSKILALAESTEA